MNKENIIKELLDYEISAVHPKIIDWQGYATTKNYLKKKIERFVTKSLKADHTSKLQVLDLQNQYVLLIRLDGTNANYSIEVYFSNFSIIENLDYFFKQIKDTFPNKNIKKIYFSDSKELSLSQNKIHDYIYTYAGKISLIKHATIPNNYNNITLRNAEGLSFYPDYKKMYADYYEDYPDLRMMIGEPESTESIEYLLENGVIKLVFINDELAGVIIGIEMIYNEMNGYFLCEKILSKKYRGKVFGIAMERKFIDLLEDSKNKLIFGTINVKNPASLKASTKIGRICVKTRYKVDCVVI